MPGQPKLQASHSAAEPPQWLLGLPGPALSCPQSPFEVFFHGLSQVLPKLASHPQVLYLGGCFIDQRKGSSVCSAPGSQAFQGETMGTGRTEASGAECIELSFKA